MFVTLSGSVLPISGPRRISPRANAFAECGMKFLLVAALFILSALPANADKCDALAPTNAQVIDEEFKGKVEGEIKGLASRLVGGAASIDGLYRKIETDDLKNYPESNKLYVWQRIIYLACLDPDQKIDINELSKLYLNGPAVQTMPPASEQTVQSAGQSGGITAGTINIYEPRAPGSPKIIDAVAMLMDEGGNIAQTWQTTGNDEALKQSIGPWVTRVYTYLWNSLGPAYAIQFKNTHEVSAVGLVGRSVDSMGTWHEVNGKVAYLNELINQLRKQ
jgi:hypothetical protein